MHKNMAKAALLLGTVSCGGNAMNENSYEVCYGQLKQYEERYISGEGYSKYSDDERLTYLNKLEEPCHSLDLSIVYRSDVLLAIGHYEEAIAELDKGIKKNVIRVGNVMMAKANALRKLRRAGISVNYSYSDITELYKKALEFENTVEPLIHLGWAETALLDGRLKEAMHQLEVGANIKPEVSRFFSLGAVVTTQMGEYEATLRMIEIAVQKGEKNYFSEPDAILAIATSLCKLGRNDEAKPIVAQAQKMGGDKFMKLPDMVKAARTVLDCPITS